MKLTFLGAAETVTGSKYLLENENSKFLVDCGLYQGVKELRLRNWAALPVEPSSIQALMITHAHIDHTGYIPVLVKNGFNGPIYATKATKDLCSLLLPDSGHIQEDDAERANRYGYSKHEPALPLYTEEDGLNALKNFKTVEYGKAYPLLKDGDVTWLRAGHILGSALVCFNVGGVKTVFTGDLGRLHDPIMQPPANLEELDYLIIESTYGDMLHDTGHPKEKLAEIINQTVKRGGTVLIPSFAVGRAQNLLYYLHLLKLEKRIPNIPIFLDSPMAINATEILRKHASEHQLTHEQCSLACNVAKYTTTVEESKALNQNPMPKVIISASGMLTGGRVLHHLSYYAPDHRNTILFTGYQAAMTRGRLILDGEHEVKLHGRIVEINAQVASLTNTSAHADYAEMLVWLKNVKKTPKHVYITHGELEAARSLKTQIENEFGWSCTVPHYMDTVELS